jgi:hypothetical protein
MGQWEAVNERALRKWRLSRWRGDARRIEFPREECNVVVELHEVREELGDNEAE